MGFLRILLGFENFLFPKYIYIFELRNDNVYVIYVCVIYVEVRGLTMMSLRKNVVQLFGAFQV